MGFRQKTLEFMAWFLGVSTPTHGIPGDVHGGDCALMLLSEVKDPEHYFYVKGTVPGKSLCDLENAIAEMDDTTFQHHVSKNKNDFAAWVREVVRDHRLANKLEQLETRDQHQRALSVRVGFLRRKAGINVPVSS